MARREQFVNNVKTTLNGGITAVATSITLTDGASFPTDGDFRIMINDEIMTVTARATHVLTVVRGTDGTTGAIQADLADVRVILTAGSINQALDDATAGYSDRLPHRILNAGATSISTDFTWVNQSTASAIDDAWGGITLKIPTNAANWSMRLLKVTSPTAPWVLVGKCKFGPGYFPFDATKGTAMGILARENSTGKLYTAHMRMGDQMSAGKFTNETTFSATLGTAIDMRTPEMWFKIEDNNTNVIISASSDGINWFQLGSEVRTTFMAGGPDEVGFFFESGNAAADALGHFQAWVVE